jgi:ABC-2 type transport system ATP-binding protein
MLQIQALTRTFGDRQVVNNVSFNVAPGRTTGFVGSNGAGKTTTMRMILGVLAPTSGQILWNGEPLTPEVRRQFGYMPEERGLYPRMKVREQLVYLARLHGYSKSDAGRRADQLLEHFSLTDRSGDLLDTLSLGNQQRVQIAAALIHEPLALVLDEPFSGLDPVAVDAMADLLAAEAGDKPLLFSSHQLDLVERLCDDLVILSQGRVVAAGPVEELYARGPQRYVVEFDGADAQVAHGVRGIQVHQAQGASATVELDGLTQAQALAALMQVGPVAEFRLDRQPLSAIFREAVK